MVVKVVELMTNCHPNIKTRKIVRVHYIYPDNFFNKT